MVVSLAVLADYANLSQEGKLNVLGVFDSMYAPSLPTMLPQCYLVLRFTADVTEKGSQHETRVRLSDPDGQLMMEVTAPLTVPEGQMPGSVTTQLITGIANLRFEKYGPHEFQILLNGEEAARLRLDVQRAPGTVQPSE